MRSLNKWITLLLLLFNGIGAVYGGAHLILHPDGSSLQLSPDWLKHTPFDDYLIPGIILFIANGLFSIFVCIRLLISDRPHALLVIAQGSVLVGWIVIQVALIRTVYFLHVMVGCVGMALILLGWVQQRGNNGD